MEPARAATNVDLPEPVGPATQMSPPGAREKVTPSTARVGIPWPMRSITRSEQSIAFVDTGLRDMTPSCPLGDAGTRYDSAKR